MASKSDTFICLNFCNYFKPGKNENLACRGYLVLQEIIRNGIKVSRERPARIQNADEQTIEFIKGHVCRRCDFLPEGCDFILTGGAAAPCGGFVLLSHLFASGQLAPEELDPRQEREPSA